MTRESRICNLLHVHSVKRPKMVCSLFSFLLFFCSYLGKKDFSASAELLPPSSTCVLLSQSFSSCFCIQTLENNCCSLLHRLATVVSEHLKTAIGLGDCSREHWRMELLGWSIDLLMGIVSISFFIRQEENSLLSTGIPYDSNSHACSTYFSVEISFGGKPDYIWHRVGISVEA